MNESKQHDMTKQARDYTEARFKNITVNWETRDAVENAFIAGYIRGQSDFIHDTEPNTEFRESSDCSPDFITEPPKVDNSYADLMDAVNRNPHKFPRLFNTATTKTPEQVILDESVVEKPRPAFEFLAKWKPNPLYDEKLKCGYNASPRTERVGAGDGGASGGGAV